MGVASLVAALAVTTAVGLSPLVAAPPPAAPLVGAPPPAAPLVGAPPPAAPLVAAPPPAAPLVAAVSPQASAGAASGAEDLTWSVRPSDGTGPDGRSAVDLELAAGASVIEHIEVSNLSDVDVAFTITAADGYVTPQGRFNMNPLDVPSTGAGTWITVDQPEVTIAAGDSADVAFRIAVPENATPGDHPAGIAASVLSTAASADGATMTVDSRVGVRVMTRVTGDLAPAVAATGVAATYEPSWNPFVPGAIDVSYALENTGNTVLAVEAAVAAAGREPGVAAAGRESDVAAAELFPGDRRDAQARITGIWPLGFATAEVRLVASAPGAEAVTVAEQVTVWTVPWLELGILVLAVIVLVSWGRYRRRRARRLEVLLAEARAEGAREAAASA